MSTVRITPLAQLPAMELSLTGVAVTFLGNKPKTKIKLTIKLDGRNYAVQFAKDSSVEWTGDIRSIAGARISIHIQCLRRARCWMGWKDFTSAEGSLTGHSSVILDVQQRISIILTVVPSHGGNARSAGLDAQPDLVSAPESESNNDVLQVSTVAEAVDAANRTVTEKTVITEKLGKVWSVLEFLKAIGEPIKEIHPAISTAITAVGALMELCEKQKACRDAALDLIDQLTSFVEIKEHEELLKKRIETRQAVKYMLTAISETSKYICEKPTIGVRGVFGDIFGNEYKEKIAGFQKTFSRAKEAFDRSVALTTFAAVDGIALTTQLMFLHEKLSECGNAHFASDGGCLKDTRADLRQRIRSWIDSTDEATPNIFWLYGKAGSGKSTVANTVAAMVKDAGLYLSCFFCKRDDPGLSSPRRLLPTLAYSIAQQHESYRAAITKLLQGPDGAGLATTTDVKTQFEKLFNELLDQIVDPLLPHVAVVDGLDECGPVKDQIKLATQILALSRALPWIKVFITSRDEVAIRQIFSQAPNCVSSNINDEAGIDSDIQRYIEAQAQALNIPLFDEEVRKLVNMAEGLFIWCRTLFEHLRTGLRPRARLDEVLSGERHRDSLHPWSKLYALYDTILASAVDNPEDVSFMQEILLIILIAARNQPLSVKAVMTLLRRVDGPYTQFGLEDAENVISRLHAVLYKDVAANDAVRAHHGSVYDYLEGNARTSTTSGWQSFDASHRILAQSCLKTLDEELKFNICNIEIPVLNKDIQDLGARISANISEELQYSSRYWFTHVSLSLLAMSEVENTILELLRTKKLLFWFECCILLGSREQIRFTFRKFMRSFTKEYPGITAAAEDACRFVSSFVDAMDSVAHIYLSALWWLPENSLTYRSLGLSKKTSWHLIHNKPKNWNTLVWRSEAVTVRSVAFSPDGQFVAYGTEDGVVYLRDAHTGTLEGEPLRRHQNAVYSIAYSPNGCFIASGSYDNTVQIWDARSGQTISEPLDGHTRTVSWIAYSPDGLFIASGSYDNTIRIWNARTRESTGEPLRHPDYVRSVAYSPDGRFIASACDDRCVHVWDTSSRQEAVGPLQGHHSLVMSVAYSPDGHCIISGSEDMMIRVWDAHTGEAIGEPLRGHSHSINFVTYSLDGHYILSGSWDGTVCLWNAASHTPLGNPLQMHLSRVHCVSYSPDCSLIAFAAHEGVHVWDASTSFAAGSQSQDLSRQAATRAIYSVAYSPDGHFVVSGSGRSDQIRIWDAQTGASVDTPVLRHTGMTQEGTVRSIAYSRDGRFIASGSNDSENSSVCVLAAQTGTTISGPLQGHSAMIWSVAYSPDGNCVASASQDTTVRMWDVQTGTAIGEPLQVGSPASCVTFSSDGRFIACGTHNGSIWIWNAHTRSRIWDPIQAHSDYVRSVAFSPDGRYITSGSDDRSVRIWDTQTGQAFGCPLQGHQSYVLCVAYSPDGRFIASSSEDKTVIVWDAQRGLAYGAPLRGHSNWIWSMAYTPDGRFLASGGDDGRIYVHHVPNDRDHVETRWLDSCSLLDPEDGWVKDGETLLLWIPVAYRENIRQGASIIIPNPTPNITAYSIDYRTLLRYSGTRWTDIISCFDE